MRKVRERQTFESWGHLSAGFAQTPAQQAPESEEPCVGGLHSDRDTARREFADALGSLYQADDLLEDAAYLLGEELPQSLRVTVEADSSGFSPGAIASNDIAEVYIWGQINQAVQQTERLMEWTEARLARQPATEG